MKEKCNWWGKSLWFTVLFFALGLCSLMPTLSVRADYKDEWQGWTGYVNDDGTFTVTGCHNDANIKGNVLEIPATIGGMRVTAVSGESQGTSDAYFGVFFPELITKLILPDTVQEIVDEENHSIFRDFINLEELDLPCEGWRGPVSNLKRITVPGRGGISSSTVWEQPGGELGELEEITFREGVTCVDFDMGKFPKLTTVHLPSTVQLFYWNAEAPSLTSLTCPKDLSKINIGGLMGCKNLHIVAYHDYDSAKEYIDSPYVGHFDNSGVTEIYAKSGPSTTYGCDSLQAIHYIGDNGNSYSEDGVCYYSTDAGAVLYRFPPAKCAGKDFVLPQNVYNFGEDAFESCKLASITVPENINPQFSFAAWQNVFGKEYPGPTCKIRVVKGSAACPYRYTEEYLANSIGGVNPSQIEFYTGNTYTISYNLDGGTNAAENPTSYRAGDEYITLKNPTRSGYTFLGWKRNDVSNGYENTTARSEKGYFQNYTFTAEWKKIETPAPSDANGSSLTSLVGAVLENVLGGNYTVTGNGFEVQYTKPFKSNVKSVTIPNTIQANGITYTVTSIAPSAFKNDKKLTNIKIGSNVTAIGASAFSSCKKLKKVTLGSGMVSIGAKAFYKCTNLSKITIPKNVGKIGKQAFNGCTKLKSIVIKSTALTTKSVGAKAFSQIYKKATVKVPKKSLKAYKKLLQKKGLSSSAKISK